MPNLEFEACDSKCVIWNLGLVNLYTPLTKTNVYFKQIFFHDTHPDNVVPFVLTGIVVRKKIFQIGSGPVFKWYFLKLHYSVPVNPVPTAKLDSI